MRCRSRDVVGGGQEGGLSGGSVEQVRSQVRLDFALGPRMNCSQWDGGDMLDPGVVI